MYVYVYVYGVVWCVVLCCSGGALGFVGRYPIGFCFCFPVLCMYACMCADLGERGKERGEDT